MSTPQERESCLEIWLFIMRCSFSRAQPTEIRQLAAPPFTTRGSHLPMATTTASSLLIQSVVKAGLHRESPRGALPLQLSSCTSFLVAPPSTTCVTDLARVPFPDFSPLRCLASVFTPADRTLRLSDATAACRPQPHRRPQCSMFPPPGDRRSLGQKLRGSPP